MYKQGNSLGFRFGYSFQHSPTNTHTHTRQNQLYIVYGIWYGAQRHPEISATEQRKAAQQRRRDGIFGVRCKQQWMTSYHLIHAPSTQTHRILSHWLSDKPNRTTQRLTDKPTWLTNLQTGAKSWNRNRITIAIAAPPHPAPHRQITMATSGRQNLLLLLAFAPKKSKYTRRNVIQQLQSILSWSWVINQLSLTYPYVFAEFKGTTIFDYIYIFKIYFTWFAKLHFLWLHLRSQSICINYLLMSS